LSLFKNTKDFFEQDGRVKMREELEKRLQEPIAAYIASGSEQLHEQFAELFASLVAEERSRVKQQVESYFTGLIAALEMKVDLPELEAKRNRVAAQLEQ
jgi:hypothetical protein